MILTPSRPSREPQRIAKLLARAGVASRREIERMIAEGRIAVDGKPVEKPATLLTSLHGVTVDGNPVQAAAPARLFRFHKPVGLLTTERDPAGRPTIYDRLPRDLPRLMPVGRLDLNTEGLLLLTTDGELKRQLELPSSSIERVYRARVFGEVSQDRLEALIQGIEIEGIRYGAIDANLERRTGRNAWVEMKLTEGKNREVRRVLEHLGLKVSRLIRVAYGPFILGDLPAGEVDEVRQHDLVQFRKNPTATFIHQPSAPPGRAERPDRAQPRGDRGERKDRAPARAAPGRPKRPERTRPAPECDGGARPKRPARPGQRPERKAAAGGRSGRPEREKRTEATAESPRRKTSGSPQRVLRAKLGRPGGNRSEPQARETGREGPGRPQQRRPAAKPGLARPGRKPPPGRPRGPRT
ncbi:MAG TPA: pseudouridine synthase [Allosphingosinicella sp.]